MPKTKNCHFQTEWLRNKKYSSWIKSCVSNNKKAICNWCRTDIDISNMGVSALDSHAAGKKHLGHARTHNAANIFFTDFTTKKSSCNEAASSSLQEQNQEHTPSSTTDRVVSNKLAQPTIEDFQIPALVTKAEIIWTLKVVMSHFSLRSCLDLNEMFITMFSDSTIAARFALSKTKCGYLINFGLAPYYRDLLLSEVRASPIFVLSYDESMNMILKNEQMDCGVRYWDAGFGVVQARYIDSKFLRRPNSQNLFDKLIEATKMLDLGKLIQVSMDGPNVNWEVLKMLNEHRQEKEYSDIVNIGSCSLHIVHGALQTGVNSQKWELAKIFRAIYNLFKESPAKIDEYIRVCESDLFALPFCATHWVEDEGVASRGIIVWPNMVKIVKYWESLCKSKRPKNKSYETLVDHYLDKFVPLRMQFFKDLAKKLKVFLVLFQTDRMVAFLSISLENMLRNLMKMILKPNILKEAATAYSLTKLEVGKSNNQLEVDQIDMGTALKQMLSSLLCRPEKKREFKKECKQIIVALLQKLQERCPLKYSIVRNASSLSPNEMVQNKETSSLKFKGLAERLSKLKWLSTDEADDAKQQYDEFVGSECVKFREKFESFNELSDSVDKFLGVYLHKNQKYSALWKVCAIIFVLSHGQSAIERGFSVNKQLLVENLQEKSLISQRIVYDHINSHDIVIHQYKLPNDLLKSCKLAYSRYNAALEENKDQVKVDEVSRKRHLVDEEIVMVKKQKENVEKCIKILKSDADKLSVEAEEKRDFTILAKANSFRNTILAKQKTIKDLDDSFKRLEQSKKELK